MWIYLMNTTPFSHLHGRRYFGMFYHAHTHTKISYNSLFSKWLNASTCAIIESFFFPLAWHRDLNLAFSKPWQLLFRIYSDKKGIIVKGEKNWRPNLDLKFPVEVDFLKLGLFPLGNSEFFLKKWRKTSLTCCFPFCVLFLTFTLEMFEWAAFPADCRSGIC